MNRTGLGLAVGAGYLLGRTKKLKLAFAVGTLVAGKRMHLSPKALADLVSQQLLKNPQFKEIGDTLREDLRGVGKAASGAMVERQIEAIADRLHGRTAQVRDELAGVAPEVPGLSEDEDEESEGDGEPREEETGDTEAEADEEPSDEYEEDEADETEDEQDEAPAAASKTAKKAPAKKAPAKKSAQKAPGRKPPTKKTAQSQGRAAGKKTAAKKTTAKKTAANKATAAGGAGRGARSRLPKGGGE
ncbi:cobalamin biosynthesis protein CobT [Streptomyces canus]|uniref:Cobalamin biosynthesis protein CobT n=1 Tax=Streptomyces canus TaxID=58343 RepID=A0AAW8F9I9_9ACTN|nr:DNA primase [Streptomyces canus]MDQ0906459.1 cobalamin biosynthesis protein CobT [Streptomyces canus]